MMDIQDARILIVDDEPGIRRALDRLFTRNGALTYTAEAVEPALKILSEIQADAVLVDVNLGHGPGGIELLRTLRSEDPDLPVVVITGNGTIETAVTAMKEGASEFVIKPLENSSLLEVVGKNIRLRRLESQNAFLQEKLSQNLSSTRFITRNDRLKAHIATVDKVKNTPATILITGESGSGKEVMAQHAHYSSERKNRSFVSINCATLEGQLQMSELFGHQKGAFTGADNTKEGKFEIANGGTLFLDEIGEMNMGTQAMLLRVLEERSFERVGGNKKIEVDVRVICATNINLEEAVNQGRFRRDLYYRINVIHIELPPLRERTEDVQPLAEFFLDFFSKRYNRKMLKISREEIERLESYHWPGNTRELKNVINQAVLLAEGTEINPLIPDSSPRSAHSGQNSGAQIPDGTPLSQASAEIVRIFEKEYIARVMRQAGGNKSEAARRLSVTRKTLAAKLEKYGL